MNNTITEIRNVFINSKDRLSGDENEFFYNLRNAILNPNAVALESVQIYNTQYTINDNNNKLYWTSSVPTNITTTLTNGNYTATTLASHIASKLNTDNDGAGTFAVTCPTSTAKMTITNDTANFGLRFATTAQSVAYTIGFEDTNKTGALTYTAENIVSLNTKYYLIYCDIGSTNTHSATETSNVIAVVPCNVNFSDLISYSPQLAKSFKFKIQELSRMKFTVRDDRGNLADLNGVDWCMNLVVSIK